VQGAKSSNPINSSAKLAIGETMKFTWDEHKRTSNVSKHGLDFADASIVFAGATFTFKDDRFDYSEHRFVTLGLLRTMVVVIAHIEQDNMIRIISMRKATRHEQKTYFERFTL
jgi:uncharacterized DUF497 family protein